MNKYIGYAPNQVPTNGMLGSLAYQDHRYVNILGGKATLSNLGITDYINIGTTTSYYNSKLSVNGNISLNGSQSSPSYIYASGSADDASLILKAGSTSNVWSGIEVTSNWNGSTNTGGKVSTYVGGAERTTVDPNGNFLVNTTGSGWQNKNCQSLEGNNGYGVFNHASGTASGVYYLAFGYNAGGIGSITQNGTTAVAYNTTSDHRLKNNVRLADAKSFDKIRFVDFEWIDGRHDCGVIAHELQEIYPDLVVGEKDATETRQVEVSPEVKDEEGNVIEEAVYEEQEFDKYQQVNYIGLIPRMGVVIQKQMKQIAELEARIAALENK